MYLKPWRRVRYAEDRLYNIQSPNAEPWAHTIWEEKKKILREEELGEWHQ